MLRVLVVEDNPVTTEYLEVLLSLKKYEVDHAGNGYGAMTRVQISRFDIILLDFMMPGMDGLEFLKQFRAMPDMRDVPVIMLTAVDLQMCEDIRQECQGLEPCMIVQKPVAPDLLFKIIDGFYQ